MSVIYFWLSSLNRTYSYVHIELSTDKNCPVMDNRRFMPELIGQVPPQMLPRERKCSFLMYGRRNRKPISLVRGIEENVSMHLVPPKVSKNTTIDTVCFISKRHTFLMFFFFWNRP